MYLLTKGQLIPAQVLVSRPDVTWNLSAFNLNAKASQTSLLFLSQFLKQHSIVEDQEPVFIPKLLDWLVTSLSSDFTSSKGSSKFQTPPHGYTNLIASCLCSLATNYRLFNDQRGYLPYSVEKEIFLDGSIMLVSDTNEIDQRTEEYFNQLEDIHCIELNSLVVQPDSQTVDSLSTGAKESSLHSQILNSLLSGSSELVRTLKSALDQKRKTLGVDSIRVGGLAISLVYHTSTFLQVRRILNSSVSIESLLAPILVKSEASITVALDHIALVLEHLDHSGKFKSFLESLKQLIDVVLSRPEESPMIMPIKESLVRYVKKLDLNLANDKRKEGLSMDDAFDLDDTPKGLPSTTRPDEETVLFILELAQKSASLWCPEDCEPFIELLKSTDQPALATEISKTLLKISAIAFVEPVLHKMTSFTQSRQVLKRETLRDIMTTFQVLFEHRGALISLPENIIAQFEQLFGFLQELWESQVFDWQTRRYFVKFLDQLACSPIAERFTISPTILGLLKDADVRVRLLVSQTLSSLFQNLGEENLFKDIWTVCEKLLENNGDESIVSALCALSNVASATQDNKPEVIHALCFYSNDPHLGSLAEQLLEAMAEKRGFSSLLTFLESNLTYLLEQSMQSSTVEEPFWKGLPLFLFGCKSETEMLQRYESEIIPCLVHNCNRDALSALAMLLERSEECLIRDHFSSCYARSFPLYFTDQNDRAKIIWEQFVSAFIPVEEISSLVTENLQMIIFKLLTSITVETSASTPNFYPKETIHMNVKQLADGFGIGVPDLLVQQPFAIHDILIGLREKVFFPAHSLGGLASCELIVRLLESHVVTPILFRDLVHFLLFSLTVESLLDESCKLLLLLCEIALKDAPSEVEEHLPSIIATLVPLTKRRSVPMPMALIHFLIADHRKELEAKIAELDPFPSEECWSDLQTVWEQVCSSRRISGDLQAQINRFIKNSSTSSSLTLLASLTSLASDLQRYTGQLTSLLSSPEGLINLLIRELIRTCSLNATHEDILLKASVCLGLVGILNPHAIAFPANNSVLITRNSGE